MTHRLKLDSPVKSDAATIAEQKIREAEEASDDKTIEKGTAGATLQTGPSSSVLGSLLEDAGMQVVTKFEWSADSGEPPPRIKVGEKVFDLSSLGFGKAPAGDAPAPSREFPKHIYDSLVVLGAKEDGRYTVSEGELETVKTYIWGATGLDQRDFKPSQVAVDVDSGGSAVRSDGSFYFSVTRPDGNKRNWQLNVVDEATFNADDKTLMRDWYYGD